VGDQRRFLHTSVILILIEVGTRLLGLIVFALVARFLGPAEVGLYALALALANLFVIPSRFGFERLVQRDIPRQPERFYSYFKEIGALKGMLSLGSLAVFAMVMLAFATPDFPVLLLVACFVFLYSFLELATALFRAVRRPALELAVRGAFSLMNLTLGSLVLVSGGGLGGFVSTQVVSVLAALFLASVIVERVAVKVPYNLRWSNLRRHAVAASPLAGTLVAMYIGGQSGTLFLSLLAEREEVGYYSAASRLFDNFALLPVAVTGAFLPVISQLHGVSVGRFVRTLRSTFKYLFVLSAPLALGTFILAHPLAELLYGQAFARAAPALQILSASLILSFWTHAGDSVLIACHRERCLLALNWTSALVRSIGSLVLIPSLSYLGPCVAVFLSETTHALVLFKALRRYFDARALFGLIRAPALCAAATGLVIYGFREWSLWVTMPLGAATYAAALFWSGAVPKTEVEQFRHMFRGRFRPSAGATSAEQGDPG